MCSIDNFRRIEKIGEGLKLKSYLQQNYIVDKIYFDFFPKGTYGVVFKAVDMETGKIVALKKIRLEK